MSEANKAMYRRFIDECLNGGNQAAVANYLTPDFIDHRAPGQDGIEGTQKVIAQVHAGFPDIHFHPEDIIAEGDRVVVRFSIRGTHRGEFMGIAATGRQVTWSGINIARMENGKFVELWGESNGLGLMRQLTGS